MKEFGEITVGMNIDQLVKVLDIIRDGINMTIYRLKQIKPFYCDKCGHPLTDDGLQPEGMIKKHCEMCGEQYAFPNLPEVLP